LGWKLAGLMATKAVIMYFDVHLKLTLDRYLFPNARIFDKDKAPVPLQLHENGPVGAQYRLHPSPNTYISPKTLFSNPSTIGFL